MHEPIAFQPSSSNSNQVGLVCEGAAHNLGSDRTRHRQAPFEKLVQHTPLFPGTCTLQRHRQAPFEKLVQHTPLFPGTCTLHAGPQVIVT
jgi:hypothetical protein